MIIIRASTHQGHTQFRGNGRQCMAISTLAILLSQKMPPRQWDPYKLDELLQKGDELYITLVEKNPQLEYLTFSDINNEVSDVNVSESLHGTLSTYSNSGSPSPFFSLEDAVDKLLTVNSQCLFTMGNTMPCYTSAIVKDDNQFYFFDSHSRSDTGMLAPDGAACMTVHRNLDDLCLFIRHLASTLKLTSPIPFEAANLLETLKVPSEPSSSDSDFSGFDIVSDGEYTCKLYLADEKVKSARDNSCDSDSSQYELDSSELSQGVQGIDDSALFMDNIDTECLSHVNDTCFGDVDDDGCNDDDGCENDDDGDVEDDGCNDDGGCDDDVEDDDDKDEDYNADESFDSSDSEDMPLAKLKKLKSKLKKSSDCGSSKTIPQSMNGMTYQSTYGPSSQDRDYPASQSGDQMPSQSGDGPSSQSRYGTSSQPGDGPSSQFGDGTTFQSWDGPSSPSGDGTSSQSGDDPSSQFRDGTTSQSGDGPSSQSGDSTSSQSREGSSSQSRDGTTSQSGDGMPSQSMDNLSNQTTVSESPSEVTHTQSGDGPSQVTRSRKRKRDPSNWKRNVAKRQCNSGEAYINRQGISKPAKMMKKSCGHKCRYKCTSHYNSDDREKIFHSFWQLADVNKQRQFILNYTEKKPKKSKTGQTNRRKSSISWFLPCPNEQSKNVKVCKTFFLNTLGISDKMVNTAHKKINSIGMCNDDSRGKHETRPNKTTEMQKMYVRQHINSFEKVESHYCRRDSKKEYLPPDLSVAEMYRLYLEYCAKVGAPTVSHYIYNEIFNTEFNLAFHTPLKDQCDFCVSFANACDEEKEKLSDKYENHMKNKDLVQKHKEADKNEASSNADTVVCCFDLEEVLLTPHSFESCLYFKRRLNTFNFTVYDLNTHDGYCYVWNEAIASRGACEIASCLFSFIQDLSQKGKKKLIMYSDNCCAQNKNRYFVTMLWYALQKFRMQSITQKYLEKGHTFNEGDSIHSAVERASKNNRIYTTPQWAATIRTARSSKPYNVNEVNVQDFYDFKELAEKLKNFETNTNDDKVYWHSIRTISFKSNTPNQFDYQTDHDGPVYTVDLFQKLRCKKPKPASISLSQLCEDGISIPRAKYVDLLKLCSSNVIPSVHHGFFLLLPHEKE